MIDCQTILPDAAAFAAELVEVVVGSVEVPACSQEVAGCSQEVAGGSQGVEGANVNLEEVFAALDIKLLYRRVGHIGKGGLDRLAREGLERGLEGGVVGEMDVCQGCVLARPRPHPHRPVDPEFRATRPLELVQSELSHGEGADSTSR